ncbi:MAG: methylisocitrate lyase [Planctomycetota bacterium]|nr:MAG: methylisocitrate lyase [Planctomycetota bacterium]
MSAGKKFREALINNKPLQIVGTINAYCATMAKAQGIQCNYLSGAGVANASFGLPDLGMTSLNDVLEDARRITSICDTPLLVDIDTGWGGAFNIAKTIKDMINVGVAAVHIEDQVSQKRCGHRPNKQIVSCQEMEDRIKVSVDARTDDDFFIIARTDAFASEGIELALERAQKYIEAGADGIFIEAVKTKEHYEIFRKNINVPLLANMTEFGQTELFHKDELANWGVDMILYPLSAFRAMNKAAELVYKTIQTEGTQLSQEKNMQTREELYVHLGYYNFEKKLDQLFEKDT